jgi:hypothetical protein
MGPGNFSASADHAYVYPEGQNLRPGSKEHQDLLTKIYNRARESSNKMSERFPVWKKIDRNLTAFVTTDEAERLVKEKDDRKPVSIVVPYSFATLETLLTYMSAAFLDSPIFRYEGVSPEDVIGAMMMEKVVDLQMMKSKAGLNLHTSYRDGYAYGLGIVAPKWDVTYGKKVQIQEDGFLSAVLKKFVGLGPKKVNVDAVLYEGNRLQNIDPYLYLPDPNVPVDSPQKGEYVGWIEETNYMRLMEMEKTGSLFNVKYLKELQANAGRSLFNKQAADSGRNDRLTSYMQGAVETRPIDVIWMYINLIPKEWKLGSGEYPEKWLFAMAADKVILGAAPMNLNHNMFPVGVCAPDSDGYSTSPVSRMEIVYGLQEHLDWLFSSHMTNVRKAINDMLVVDPSLININDLKDPAPGKLLRMRRAAWGRGVENAVKQLSVVDVTRGHMQDTAIITDLMQKCTGSVDAIMGFQRHSSERVSATESKQTRGGALSRLQKAARIVSLQMMQDLGYMIGSHTQQLMSNELFVNISGRWMEDLKKEYGDVSRMKVSPMDLAIDFDVYNKDGSIQGTEDGDLWIQLYQIIGSNPLLQQQFDTAKIFVHIARQLGAKDVQDFVKKIPQQANVVPDATVEKEVQAGNMIPAEAIAQIGGGVE